jgi:hypothetical protein
MRKLTLIIFGLVLAAAVILPWWAVYQSDKGGSYSYGLFGGRQLECVAVDGTHFDRYFCLVFDGSAGARVSYGRGRIFLDGRPIQFPSGRNAGFLRADGQIQFATVTEQDIAPSGSGNGEIYYIFGKVPKLKRFTFGVPRAEFIEQRFQSLK